MDRVIGQLGQHRIERLDQHVDSECAGDRGKPHRQASKRVSVDGEESGARQGNENQIARVRGDARENSDKRQYVCQRPCGGDGDQLSDQRIDQAGLLRNADPDHGDDQEPDGAETEKVRNQSRVDMADAVRVQQAVGLGCRGLDLESVGIDDLVGNLRTEQIKDV